MSLQNVIFDYKENFIVIETLCLLYMFYTCLGKQYKWYDYLVLFHYKNDSYTYIVPYDSVDNFFFVNLWFFKLVKVASIFLIKFKIFDIKGVFNSPNC